MLTLKLYVAVFSFSSP